MPAPWLRGTTTATRPARPHAAASARNAASIGLGRSAGRDEREDRRPGAGQARTRAPRPRARPASAAAAPGRRPSGTARGGGRWSGRRAARGGRVAMPATPIATRPRFSTAWRSGTCSGSTPPHVLGRQPAVGDEQHAAQAVRGVEPDGRDAIGELRRDDEPAEQHGGRVVGVGLDRRRDLEQRVVVGRVAPASVASAAPRRPRRRSPRPTSPSPRDSGMRVVHRDPPADAGGPRPERRLERRLEAGDEPVRAGRRAARPRPRR